MKVAEKSGLLSSLASLLRPCLAKLFPEIPKDHPAMGAMIMNLSANMMGLANAATPFGIKAMKELETLNPTKGVASDAMILFLAINTSSVVLIPTGIIALRATSGSADSTGIVGTTLFATAISTTVAIVSAKLWSRKKSQTQNLPRKDTPPFSWKHKIALFFALLWIPAFIIFGPSISPYILPSLIFSLVTYGCLKKVPVYEAMIEGATEGFQVAVTIIPYLVTILVSIAMFRAIGALSFFVEKLEPITTKLGMPVLSLFRCQNVENKRSVVAERVHRVEAQAEDYPHI